MSDALPILYIGNRNYSSWSLRPWLFLHAFGVAFEERLITLDTADFLSEVAAVSPTLRVPVLKVGDLTVWDSLAICQYAAEQWVGSAALPQHPAARALAWSMMAEMHSGFSALRTHCPMNIRRAPQRPELPSSVLADAQRMQTLWQTCRQNHGQDGAFLFGAFSMVDAYFAPVVTRFLTYQLPMDTVSAEYARALMAMPSMQIWCAAARAEPWSIAATDQI